MGKLTERHLKVYDYKCTDCELEEQRYTFYKDRDIPFSCPERGCDGEMLRIPSATRGFVIGRADGKDKR